MAKRDGKSTWRGVPILGDVVRRFRLRKGWTQVELARKAGCDKKTVENMENSRRVKFYNMDLVATALGVSHGAICPDIAAPPSPPVPVEGMSFKLSMPQEDLSKPVLVAYFCEVFQRALADYEAFKQSYAYSGDVRFFTVEELREYWQGRNLPPNKINIYFIPGYSKGDIAGVCARGTPIWCYVVIPQSLHDEAMEHCEAGGLHDEFVIVARGVGEPTPEIKATIKQYYGFDHDRCALVKTRLGTRGLY